MITPDGDGRNEETTVSYTQVQLRESVPVNVEIFTIGGHRVRTLFSGMESSGSFEWNWDGRDDRGEVVPVGIYLAKVTVDAELQRYVRLGTVGIVY